MAEYTAPQIFIEKTPELPPTIKSVATAVPVFIGYTEKAMIIERDDLLNRPQRISSILEYERFFGSAQPETSLEVLFDTMVIGRPKAVGRINPKLASKFILFYALRFYFANGGGPCYITSVGTYSGSEGQIRVADLILGLDKVHKLPGVTLIVIPDATGLSTMTDCFTVYQHALAQCETLKDRFVIMDLSVDTQPGINNVNAFRSFDLGSLKALRYGAIYYPRVFTTLDYCYTNESSVKIYGVSGVNNMAQLKAVNNTRYLMAKEAIKNLDMLLPCSSAVAAQYFKMDLTKGVWKSPANVGIELCTRPEKLLTDNQQAGLNVDPSTGRSINVIRSFPGRGPAIIWGARTLAGNDNEWRYVSVSRFFIMVESSVSKGLQQLTFEPNDINTWVKAKAMIEDYLIDLWKQGALPGSTSTQALYVKVGLNETMTEADVTEGRMIVQIGMAMTRPAEFIILNITHQMLAT